MRPGSPVAPVPCVARLMAITPPVAPPGGTRLLCSASRKIDRRPRSARTPLGFGRGRRVADLARRPRLRPADRRRAGARPAGRRAHALRLRRRADGLAAPGPAQPGVVAPLRAPARAAYLERRLHLLPGGVEREPGYPGRARCSQ